MPETEDFSAFVGTTIAPKTAPMPLEQDTIRRFVQAIMDADPVYYDEAEARRTRFGAIIAPPLYPVHAFRHPAGAPDPLAAIQRDPDSDGTEGSDAVGFGLPPIPSPFKRMLNGGNEIEFFRCLRVGETAVARPRYADVSVKHGKSGDLLLVVIETAFSTTEGDPLLINRQTLIWR
ncbi:MAG: MaoC family dehydratase N-terminal domain-containing protein [Acidisphaera sp.]|nr:MaoC family dehydratase N-terminal domain-containing protein [Acidisphaera sp.]